MAASVHAHLYTISSPPDSNFDSPESSAMSLVLNTFPSYIVFRTFLTLEFNLRFSIFTQHFILAVHTSGRCPPFIIAMQQPRAFNQQHLVTFVSTPRLPLFLALRLEFNPRPRQLPDYQGQLLNFLHAFTCLCHITVSLTLRYFCHINP